MELILAFGNYMNRGQRGNAVGFKLNSLTRIADTKSSCNKNMTLLHYIADTCQHKFRDCLLLEADMPHVRDAAKVKWVHMISLFCPTFDGCLRLVSA